MSTSNFKRCNNCGVVRDSNDTFCGNCGKPFKSSASGSGLPTVLSGQMLSTKNTPIMNTTQPFYTPIPPTQPAYPTRSSSHKAYLIISVLIVMLIGAGLFIGIQIGKGNTPITTGHTNTPNTSQQTGTTPVGNNPTITVVQPSPTQTIFPSPTPTSVVNQVLYETHDFNNWTGTSDWKVLTATGMLVNDATCDHSQSPYGPSVPAPYLVQGTNDYAVEAKIQVSSTNVHSYYPCFGITVRGNPVGDSWQGYYVGVGCNSYLTSVFISNVNTIDSYLKEAQFDPQKSWHTYRVEVKQNTISLLVDGGPILQLTDNNFLSGSQVGLFCYSTQLSVSDFKVIGL